MKQSETQSFRYYVQDNRSILKLFASKSPYHVLAFVIPYLIGVGYLATQAEATLKELGLGIVLGFFYWSFVEYLIHRYYFHFPLKNKTLKKLLGSFHLYHHQNPLDMEVINSGWLTATMGVFFHYAVLYGATLGNNSLSLCILFFTIATYYFYEWVHYLVHQKHFKSGVMKYLQEFHLTHHVTPDKNYGQITPIWDYLMGTVTKNIQVADHKGMAQFVLECRKEKK